MPCSPVPGPSTGDSSSAWSSWPFSSSYCPHSTLHNTHSLPFITQPTTRNPAGAVDSRPQVEKSGSTRVTMKHHSAMVFHGTGNLCSSKLHASADLEESAVDSALKQEVRVLCWVMSSHQNTYERAIHVNSTWAGHCDKVIFFSVDPMSDRGLAGAYSMD